MARFAGMTTPAGSRSVLPLPHRVRPTLTTYDAKDPETVFPPIEPLRPPEGAPNVLVILLDDVNLQRLLTVMEELRESSQLLVITHQKRTMEIADALYGVTMRGDGVTTVISQRMHDDARV